MCCSSQRRSAAARYRNCADILSGVFKISLCVFAGESHCGRVRDRAGRSGVWRGWAWPCGDPGSAGGWPRRRRSSRFSPCAASSSCRRRATSARCRALRAVSSAESVRMTPLAGPGSPVPAAGREAGAAVCCLARRCSIRDRIGRWLERNSSETPEARASPRKVTCSPERMSLSSPASARCAAAWCRRATAAFRLAALPGRAGSSGPLLPVGDPSVRAVVPAPQTACGPAGADWSPAR